MAARILACIGAGFLMGVCVRSFAVVPLVFVLAVLGVAVLLAAVSLSRRARYAALAACVLSGGMLGVVRMDHAIIVPDPAMSVRVGEHVSLEGYVEEEPDVREGSTRLTVRVSRIDDATVLHATRAIVIVPPYTEVQYGDTITADGALRAPESFESGDGRTFNYRQYLAARGVSYEVGFAHIQTTGHGGNILKRSVISVKRVYITGLHVVLPEPYAGLAAGITAGDKRSVGSDVSETFQRVSLVHILVLSGYNITVVLGAFMGMFSRMRRTPQLIAVLAIVSFFIIVAGGAASAARAGMMAFAAVYAKLFGRMFLALRVLVAVVCAMILWNPYLLAFDPGFQLSVLATLGLILFSPHIARALGFIPERYQLREIAAATVSTQLTVLPLLLYQNGTLSVVSLPANLLALIAVPAAMAFSGIAALAGIVFGTWGALFAFPAYILLRYIVSVADVFASLPYAAISVPAFSVWILAVLYGCIACTYVYLRWRYSPEV